MSPERLVPSFPTAIRSLFKRVGGPKLLAGASASLFALTLAVGAGAAPSPVQPVAEVIGLGGEHGAAVSQAVKDAKEAGEKVGPAVSEDACTAAHERSTLPEWAQNAPGQEDREAKDCAHPSNVDEEAGGASVIDATAEGAEEQKEVENHGSVGSQAVHDAKAAAKEAGDKVGLAVSEAACTAAHDRNTLPEGAQNAPGQQSREAKDCTHPSNVDDEDVEPSASAVDEAPPQDGSKSKSGGHGKDSAPGQQKKSAD